MKEIASSGTYNLNWGEKIQMCQIQEKVEAAGHNSIEGVERNIVCCSVIGFDESACVQTGHCDQTSTGKSFQVQPE